MNDDDKYVLYQREFFRHHVLRDGSDKFYSEREKLAKYAFETGGIRALDVGTGHGFQAVALKKVGFKEVVGIDLVSERIEYCKKIHKNSGVRFKTMDAANLNFPDKHFDSTAVSAVLHDIPLKTRVKAISEIVRVTKNTVVIFEPKTFRNLMMKYIYGYLGEFFDESVNFHEYVGQDLDQILNSYGVKVIRKESAWHGVLTITVGKILNHVNMAA